MSPPKTLDSVHFGGRWSTSPLIVGTAAWNGLAFSPYQTWAFRRAELSAFAETPFRARNGRKVTMAPIRTLPTRDSGAERLVPIATRTLSQLLKDLGELPPKAVVALVLCLPERMVENSAQGSGAQRRRVEQALMRVLEERGVSKPLLHVEPRGHASLAFALIEAGVALRERKVDVAFVGGVDTHYDPEVVQELLDRERIFDGENLNSFVGGEGAAFCALTRPDVAKRMRWPVLARLDSVATDREAATEDNDIPCRAEGLSRAGRVVSERLREERRSLDWWLSDMTAEELRVHEFQLAWPRVAHDVMPPESTLDFLSECLGDLGAAAMPTGLAIAVEGMLRGDPAASNCLLTGSSVGGARGVVLLSKET
ncbi:3-oxoacyl-(acyl carrier protein) synthase [Myxococcus stipitatus DSM 14675]|uniref:3-oxoacyl-(Acyl carrier protein) synthase n=1 Tax=Myxococcus stipitatus (strain DSM 14675 / JCM 12634 / Mx s8) TaxID=1278073 RepID=L7UJS2_MYXSD|nr:3-oxoacyl-ACP synthase [Myxococcus stipitatus]AGC48155.1 3-oxoacyl-(acyl carrier protein) synthase [Myxococcus stipitatus DSM 14675]